MLGNLNLIGDILSGAIIKSLANDEAIYNDLGIKRQSLVNWERQQAVNQQNMDFQREMNALNIQNAWDMFNATNAYNSPLAQMQRFKAAGLNPNLIYGQSNTASSVNIPSMQSPEMRSYNSDDPTGMIMNVFGQLLKIPAIFEQYKSMKLQNDNLGQDNLIKRAMADYWTNKAMNEGYRSAQHMWNNLLYTNLFNSTERDTVAKLWFENLKDSLQTAGLKNKVFQSQEAYIKIKKDFEDLRKKWYGGFDDSKGIFQLQQELLNTTNDLKSIDLNFEKAMDFSKVANPFLQFLGNMIKSFFKM